MLKLLTSKNLGHQEKMAPKAKVAKTIVKKGPKVRSSITPGTILILLSGRFRGKKVVCLGSTASGLLVVTGPMKVNGVPLRRVNQRYVIATSTKVALGKVDASAYTDKFFARQETKKGKSESEFFAEGATK